MRTATDKFIQSVRNYLESAFHERVERINAEDSLIHMTDIAEWSLGYKDVLSGLENYPGCLILVNGRTLEDAYTTAFSLVIGIAVTADDPSYKETLGRLWEDILEDSIRSDWSLGSSCLDTDLGAGILTDATSGIYLIQAELTCHIDLGGFVYEEN